MIARLLAVFDNLSLGIVVLAMFAWGTSAPARAENPITSGERIRLWDMNVPDGIGHDEAKDIPDMIAYPPIEGTATGAAIILFPGGSYGGLTDEKEMATWLNTLGITSFVLKYRLGPRYGHKAIIEDAARAIRVVRGHADAWHLDPHRLGLMGRSAGGHLATIIASDPEAGKIARSDDPIDHISARPDLLLLIYPLITMEGVYRHPDSQRQFLGDHPSQMLLDRYSLQKHITSAMPPTFIVHGVDDKVVPVENSLMLASSLKKANVPFALHIYDHGPHGFGIDSDDPAHGTWTATLAAWLKEHGFLESNENSEPP